MVYMVCDRCGKKMTNAVYYSPMFPTCLDPNANIDTLPKYSITKVAATEPLQLINLCPDCENALDNFIFDYKNLCAQNV